MSNSSIMSVREMIDTAFGETDVNIINFKLIQTILYILARQLRLLERRVGLTIHPSVLPSASSLSITEVKIKATVSKKKKVTPAPPIARGKSPGKQAQAKPKPKPESIKTVTDLSSSSKTTSDPTKSSTSKSSTSKTTSETTKTTTEQSSSAKTSSEPTTSTQKSSTSKTTSDPTKTTTEESSKTTSDLTKTSTDKTSSSKTTSEPTKTSTEKSSSSKTTSDTTKTSTEMSSSLKLSTDKSSSSRSKSTSVGLSSEDRGSKEYYNMLQIIEEQREREIRTIHQRANSKEEAAKSPTPMASLDTMETHYEKLLVVERVPSSETKPKKGRKSKTPQISVVTQEQYEDLAMAIREIQNKFKDVGKAEFPENAELMHELRQGASLTDAMAALQLSARLDAAEVSLKQLLAIVTELARRKGIDLNYSQYRIFIPGIDEKDVPQDTISAFEQAAAEAITSATSKSRKSTKIIKENEMSMDFTKSMLSNFVSEPQDISTIKVDETTEPMEDRPLVEKKSSIQMPTNLINRADLDREVKQLYDGIMKAVTNVTTKATGSADFALKTANRLEARLEEALNLGNRMHDLDALVSHYVDQVNAMDTNLSAQMTNYQDELTQMQHELEAGIENMAEAMANTGGDTVAVAELNAHFTDLQVDFDNTNTRQKELREYQDCLALDLKALLKQIEVLRETKSDREEVADALRDKAGLGALNGLVTLQQFNAVRGDFEKRIGAAYDKFNNQEIIWQKAIDDLLRELNEKADLVQVMCLRDDVNNNLEKLSKRMQAMMDIVGEPRAASVAKKLFRDTACLSCATAARMELEEDTIPALPAFTKTGKQATKGAKDNSKPKESGDYICYPGQPIRHPIDERAHICTRYCGGSHTTVSNNLGRAPASMLISSMPHKNTEGLGTDGKVYLMAENEQAKKPCVPCNQPYLTNPQPSEADQAPTESSDMVPWDFMPLQAFEPDIAEDVTPPPPTDDLD